ncbi:MAG TPA: CBS domain-containing protein [Sphingobium sp.]|jgi:CBS domain-containing protein|uniref:CBS domain-containing protein n=1 Tax=unclassified Sphingobium TaxID=2611147 RepID=UPI0007F37E00|nr:MULTISPECIES: CBS domain-containing protein [unclassified Sphingobium]OAN50917.1 histidine kinase [Sphingobium sp. TCM1]WIW87963.1 CBS domain-containing protein [Sphingobium sp. V4]HAF41095.1 CBS domain-containing protein [Sphingobium sp.]
MTIAAILQGKGRDVIQVKPTDSVLSAVQLLADKRIGCVPVVENGDVLGIFSERDLLYRVASDGAAALDHTVGEVMTAPAITIDDQTPVLHGLSLMTKRRVRHLPVVIDGKLVGLISIGDLVKFRIDTIESEAASLRDYIQTA